MPRYSKISKGTLDDEKFRSLTPSEKLVWLSLLIHPAITPMGAGLIYPVVLAEMLSLSAEQTDAALTTLVKREMILRDGRLIILKNWLLPDYNLPESPHTMKGWVSACETLPRSPQFAVLRDHLKEKLDHAPSWLFRGLLDPLSQGDMLGLDRLFWDRTGLARPTGKRGQSTGDSRGGSTGVSRVQDHDHDHDREQKKKKEPAPASLRSAGIGASFTQVEKADPERKEPALHLTSDTNAENPSQEKSPTPPIPRPFPPARHWQAGG